MQRHKPEIAIAIDNLSALVGLKPILEIKTALEKYPEIKKLLSKNLVGLLNDNEKLEDGKIIKRIYSEIMEASNEIYSNCILLIKERLDHLNDLTESEKQFLIQYDNFGVDIGLISILIFNLVSLKKGEAIFTPAGIPHAYLKGNILECMANSDNVVRAGLTPKYKDISTLTQMLETDLSKADVNKYETEEKIVYKTSAEEFEIEYLKLLNTHEVNKNEEIKILIVLNGKIELSWGNNKLKQYNKGDVVLIPALLNDYSIQGKENPEVYQVKIP